MTARTAPHPFTDSQWQAIQELLKQLDDRQAVWLSGFLAGRGNTAVDLPATDTGTAKTLIAFGGETGNSEALARQLAEQATERGVPAEVADLATLRLRQLAKRQHVLIICSTHGDGDPPEPIHAFYEALMAENAPALKNLRYSVLALGDSSYEHFCVTGRELDDRLAALGAERLAPRQDCDVDFNAPARQWMETVLKSLPSAAERSAAPPAAAATTAAPVQQGYSKQQPLAVEVLDNVCLSAPGRRSPIHHLELALEAPGFDVQPGDAVGVLAHNPPGLVAAILDATQLSGEQPVTLGGEAMPLVQALREQCDLTIPSKRFLETWAGISDSAALKAHAEADAKAQRAFLQSRQLRDLMSQHPGRPEAQALVDSLRPLQPRLYDVANSTRVVDDELHLTVKHYRYAFANREETGIASDYLLQLQAGDSLNIYPHRNARFRLPDEPGAPLILVADGTGIAPYRAFLQELAAGERRHPCWLVFAEQRFEDDFLYQLDWQQAQRDGLLERVDTVFYRDHPGRTLGDALVAQPDRLLGWLNGDAHLYLCGDKERLTQCEKAVQALFDARADADGNWKQLVKAKRIHRNLY